MGAIVEILLQVLAGMGLAWGADKVLPSKVPGYQPVNPVTGNLFSLKNIILVVCLVLGGFLVIFVAKKLKLNLFKRR